MISKQPVAVITMVHAWAQVPCKRITTLSWWSHYKSLSVDPRFLVFSRNRDKDFCAVTDHNCQSFMHFHAVIKRSDPVVLKIGTLIPSGESKIVNQSCQGRSKRKRDRERETGSDRIENYLLTAILLFLTRELM